MKKNERPLTTAPTTFIIDRPYFDAGAVYHHPGSKVTLPKGQRPGIGWVELKDDEPEPEKPKVETSDQRTQRMTTAHATKRVVQK